MAADCIKRLHIYMHKALVELGAKRREVMRGGSRSVVVVWGGGGGGGGGHLMALASLVDI